MKKLYLINVFIISALIVSSQTNVRQQNIGDLVLLNGKKIKDCTLGFSTWGKPNSDTSNVFVLLTWFGGFSSDYIFATEEGKWADSTKYYVVAIDALGNSISSSPSNSPYGESDFPEFCISDMVNSQYKLLKDFFKISHLFAIGGFSMGGFQTYQWIASYPEYMDRAVIIQGTPSPNTYDKLFYTTVLDALDIDSEDNRSIKDAFHLGVEVFILNFLTPEYFQENITLSQYDSKYNELEKLLVKIPYYDWKYQMKALLTQDIYTVSGKSLDEMNNIIVADVLIIVNEQDHAVNPGPSVDFAIKVNAELYNINSYCGHNAFGCEQEKISNRIISFLEK